MAVLVVLGISVVCLCAQMDLGRARAHRSPPQRRRYPCCFFNLLVHRNDPWLFCAGPDGFFNTPNDLPLKRFAELEQPDCSDLLQGTLNEQRMLGLEGTAGGEPFRRFIAHPSVTTRFNWSASLPARFLTSPKRSSSIVGDRMLGPGWYGGSGGAASVNRAGSTGQKLHGPGHASPSYYSGSWSGHPQKLNYSWQLQDVGPQDGGFVLVPVREGSPFARRLLCFHGPGHSNHNAAGWSCRFTLQSVGNSPVSAHVLVWAQGSHKMSYPLPWPSHRAIELPAVRHLTSRAGDVVIYL